MNALFKTAALALSLLLISTGCATTNATTEQTSNSDSSASNSSNQSQASSGESPSSGSQSSSSQSPSPSSQSSSSAPPASSQPAVPAGFTLESNCSKGTGATGIDIYYLAPSSGSQRFMCVHRTGKSPYINNDDAGLDHEISDAGGGYCAYSWTSDNVGCALSPITKQDLMNPPPQGVSAPAGYVLEDCQQGTGATGKTIYYRPEMPARGANHPFWYQCVHRTGNDPGTNVLAGGVIAADPKNPYCAFSTVSKNIGCALEPITSKDLMNPS
jgi:hypothetical protein